MGRAATIREASVGSQSGPLVVPPHFTVAMGTATVATLFALGLFFLKAGAFIFGSGLAIVPFLREGVVDQHHWLTERQFLDAVAMGLITPGPVVITAAFIGYSSGALRGPPSPPSRSSSRSISAWFSRVVVHPPPGKPQVKAFVKGATAAAAGAIGGATIVLTRGAVTDVPTIAILLVSLLFVWRFKNKEPVLVVAAAIAGIALRA